MQKRTFSQRLLAWGSKQWVDLTSRSTKGGPASLALEATVIDAVPRPGIALIRAA